MKTVVEANVVAVDNVGSPSDLLVTLNVGFTVCGTKRSSTLQVGIRSDEPINKGDRFTITVEKAQGG